MLQALRSKLLVRLAALFLVASLAPLVGTGMLMLHGLESSIRRDAARRHAALGDFAAGTVRGLIERGMQKLRTLGRLLSEELPSLERPTQERAKLQQVLVERLNRLVDPPDLFLELQYYSAAATKTPEFLVNVGQKSYEKAQELTRDFKAQQMSLINENLNASIVQEPVLFNREFSSKQPEDNFGFSSLSMSVPLTRNGRVLGAVLGYLDLRRLPQLLDPLAHGNLSLELNSGGGRSLASVGGTASETIGDTRPVGYSDWRIEVREPESVVTGAVSEARGRVLLWLGLAAALAILLSGLLSAWIVKPVHRLTDTAQRMESGDLSARSGIERQDEIGRLGSAFDRMAAALEELDELKSEFIANVSHELRTPLTSMRLSIANLIDGVVAPSEEGRQKALSRMQADVDRLIAMVNDLLQMARLGAGVEHPKKSELNLEALARSSAEGLESLAREKGIEIVVSGQGRASGDAGMLQRVLTNLVDNALKFSPEGGQVRISVADGELRVSDQGPGLVSQGLFERFCQGEDEGRKNPGVGLGLGIVQKLVELHGGSIHAESDDGSTFVIKL